MAKLTRLGDLERAVMDHLWSAREPQTVRQVHEALSAQRDLAYTTIMTVLQRLAKKNLVVQHRDDRAHRYAPPIPVAGTRRSCTSSSASAQVKRQRFDAPSPSWKPSMNCPDPVAVRALPKGD
jgi:predicted transcriptional regulator